MQETLHEGDEADIMRLVKDPKCWLPSLPNCLYQTLNSKKRIGEHYENLENGLHPGDFDVNA